MINEISFLIIKSSIIYRKKCLKFFIKQTQPFLNDANKNLLNILTNIESCFLINFFK